MNAWTHEAIDVRSEKYGWEVASLFFVLFKSTCRIASFRPLIVLVSQLAMKLLDALLVFVVRCFSLISYCCCFKMISIIS